MTTAPRRSVGDWEQMLLEMGDAYQRGFNYHGNDEFEYVWLPLENDDDMIQLAQALRNRDQSIFQIFLEVFSGFTERGAHLLAEGFCQANVKHVRVRSVECGDDSDAVAMVVRILYMEGNQPYIDTFSSRIDFELNCLKLQRNEIGFSTCSVWLYFLDGCDGVIFGNSLCGNSSLKHLCFTMFGHEDETALVTTKSARAIAKGIQLSDIQKLIFHFDKDDNNGNFVRVLCQQGIKASGRLFEVTGRVSHESELANVLSSLTALSIEQESIWNVFKETRVPLNVGLFNEGLRQTSSLVSLTLSNCVVGVEGMKNLSLALQDNRSVQILKLPRNHISDEGIIEFVRNWRDDSGLVSLQLNHNDIGPVGLQHLLPGVANHRAVYDLGLCVCRSIGLLGLQLIGNEMHNMTLKKLDVSYCLPVQMGKREESEDVIQAYAMAQAKTRQCVVEGMKTDFYLCDLELSRNDGLFDDVLSEIGFYLDLNRCGRHLLANGCVLPPTIWCYILANCSTPKYFTRRHSLTFYFLLEQPMLLSGFNGMNRKRPR
jgi:hypothetical protein